MVERNSVEREYFAEMRDHESFRSSGEEVVWHSYGGAMEDFKELIKLCKKYGLTFYVSGISEYFPRHSFKIALKRTLRSSSANDSDQF